jgi:hypothetical protein
MKSLLQYKIPTQVSELGYIIFGNITPSTLKDKGFEKVPISSSEECADRE